MALNTKQQEDLIKVYIAAFDRAPDAAGLSFWANSLTNGTFATVTELANSWFEERDTNAGLTEVRDAYPSSDTTEATVTKIYQNVFGRDPDAEGLAFWSSAVTTGVVSGLGDLLVNMFESLSNPGSEADKAVFDNKVEVAKYFAVEQGLNDIDLAKSVLADVDGTQASVDTAKSDVDGNANPGQTFTLTTGVDQFTGTTSNDTFISLNENGNVGDGAEATYDDLDVLDGGAGTDTLQILVRDNFFNSTLASGTSVQNIEKVTVNAAADTTLDTTSWTGLESIETDQVIGQLDITASDTTAINAAGVDGEIDFTGGSTIDIEVTGSDDVETDDAAGAITIVSNNHSGDIATTDGTDVTVTSTSDSSTGDITIGSTGNEQSGAVVVTQTLTSDGANLNNFGDEIEVNGGTTVEITATGSITADDLGQDGNFVGGSYIDVNGDANTTDVTITQSFTATDYTEAGDAAVTATSEITFEAISNGEEVEVDGLIFTASKDLTAAEVAAAFANLTNLDLQEAGGFTANGVYTGQFGGNWTSGAANGAVVSFTTTAINPGSIAPTSNATDAPTETYTAGTPATADQTADVSAFVNSVEVDGDAITTVTIDGFDGADIGDADSMDELTTINLSNGSGDVDINSAQAAVTLNIDNVDLDLDTDDYGNSPASLVINATGEASSLDFDAGETTDLTINASVDLDITDGDSVGDGVLESVVITGAGAVSIENDLVFLDHTAGTLKTFDASANTGGVTTTLFTDETVLDSTFSSFELSAGNDSITLGQTDVDADINLNDGDDSITLASGTTVLASDIDAGAGTDTLVMDAADAATASASTAFEGKIDGFEKLSLNQASANLTVDMANMDDIDYVISANATGNDGAQSQVYSFNIAGLVLDNTGTLDFTINGDTQTAYTAAANNVNATAIGSAIDGDTITINGVAYDVSVASGTIVTLTSTADVADQPALTVATTGENVSGGSQQTYSFDLTGLSLDNTGVLSIDGVTLYTSDANDKATADIVAGAVAASPVTIGGEDYTVTNPAGNQILLTSVDNIADQGAKSLGFTNVAVTEGQPERFTLDLTGLSLDDTGTLSIGGVLAYTSTGTNNAAAIAGDLDSTQITIAGETYDISAAGAVLTLESVNNGPESTPTAATTTGETPDGAGNAQVYDLDIAGAVLNATDTIEIDGDVIYTAPGAATNAATIAAALDTTTVTIGGVDYTVAATGTALELTSTGNVAPQGAVVMAIQGSPTAGFTDATVTDTTPGVADGSLTINTPTLVDGQNGVADVTNSITSSTVTAVAGVADTTFEISDATVTETSGSLGGSAILTIDNFAANGTLEINEAGSGITVIMEDATGSSDVLNVVTTDLTGDDLGMLTADGVETVAITTTDTFTDGNADGVDDVNSTATLDVESDTTTTITVAGAGDLTLTNDDATVTTVNASSMTGALTFTADVNAQVVTGGEGADILTADADEVEINGGAGNDTITIVGGNDLVVVDGGAGADTFVITGAADDVDSYAVFKNVDSGDVFDLSAFGIASFDVAKVELSQGATESSQAYLNQAIEDLAVNEMGWFQYAGNTFIVVEQSNTDSFVDGTDVAVMIEGLVDLSTGASFNNDVDFIEIA